MAYPVRLRVDFLKSPTAQFTVIGARVILREYRHEVCIVRLRNTSATNNTYRSGAPIKVQYGFFPNGYELFVGHVLWAKPTEDRQSRRSAVEVVCIGATYQFKDAHQRLFTDTSPETVIGSIAAGAAFDYVCDSTGIVWPTIASPGHTDWTFMVDLAKKRGATLYARRVGLYCYDPVLYLLANLRSWPVVKFSDADGSVTHVLNFDAHLSDDETTTRYRVHHLKTVDSLTKEIIETIESSSKNTLATTVKAPTFKHYLNTPSDSSALSNALVDAAGKVYRFNQRLRLRMPGNVAVHAGTGLVLKGFDKETDGLWYVCGVEHDLDTEVGPATYWCDVTLLRDSHSSSGAPALPLRQESRNHVVPRESTPLLVGNKFISPHRRSTVLNYGKLVAA